MTFFADAVWYRALPHPDQGQEVQEGRALSHEGGLHLHHEGDLDEDDEEKCDGGHYITQHLPVPVEDLEIEDMFNFADKNQDGKISYTEFEVISLLAC